MLSPHAWYCLVEAVQCIYISIYIERAVIYIESSDSAEVQSVCATQIFAELAITFTIRQSNFKCVCVCVCV